MDNLRDLEKILQQVDQKLFDKYSQLVSSLSEKVYKNINESLAVSFGIYTNHDKEHFDKVIEQAGYLLQADKILHVVHKENELHKLSCEDKITFFFLNSMELFIFLCSIRVHDIGLIIDREHHSTNISYTIQILNIEIQTSVKRIIAQISGAHTGKDRNGSNDKISELERRTSVKSQMIRPQMLASLVRFSDELEEGAHRTSNTKLQVGKVDKKNIVFHKYSLAITDLSIQHDANSICLSFEIDDDENMIYEKPKGEKVTLLEEIYNRLQKLEQERKYFHRFLCNSMSIERIESKIFFNDKFGNIGEPILITTGETYPGLNDYGLEKLKEKIEKDKNG